MRGQEARDGFERRRQRQANVLIGRTITSVNSCDVKGAIGDSIREAAFDIGTSFGRLRGRGSPPTLLDLTLVLFPLPTIGITCLETTRQAITQR